MLVAEFRREAGRRPIDVQVRQRGVAEKVLTGMCGVCDRDGNNHSAIR